MVKPKILFDLLAIGLIVAILIISAPNSATSSKQNLEYSFSVISDTHVGISITKQDARAAIENTTTALNCIKNCFPKDKCIVINGDIVDNYHDSSYNALGKIISKVNKTGKKLPYIF